MSFWIKLGTVSLLVLHLTVTATLAQTTDVNRLRDLRMKSRSGTLTGEEKAELDTAMQARTGSPTRPPSSTPATPAPLKPPVGTPTPSQLQPGKPAATPSPAQPRDPSAREQRMAQYAERQEFSLERMRQMGKDALATAAARRAPDGPARALFTNNETGDDNASGLSPDKAVRTLAKAVSMLKPGDTLHLAVTNQPYRETLRFGDDFGGVAGKPIVIEGHGATLTGSDPLRLDGWVEAGAPGLYKSAKFLSELEEFTDEAKLMRVFLIFDGVVQHMGRSSKGAHGRFKAPTALQPGEWTYAEAEKAFYIKVSGKLADANIEAPYRRNGLSVRTPKIAMTHVVIKDLIVCHVLNDDFNLHGATRDVLLQNIAAIECGDDGISPHETCEVTIDGFWSIGNSTGMGNGNLSVTKASNVRLEGNLAHQFMTGHAPATELRNAIIIAPPGTQPINVTNAQDTRLVLDNVQITSAPGQKVLNVVNGAIDARRITAVGPGWENAGKIRVTESVIAGSQVANLPGGTWTGDKNVYAIAFGPEAQNTNCVTKEFGQEVLQTSGQPFPGAGANPAEFKIPPRPVPHPAAGKFTSMESLAVK
jgi:hypothetical protein